MASANSINYGRSYVPEEPEVYHGRKALADQLIAEGKSYKYAWYHAFKKFPRVYTDTIPTESVSVETTITPTGAHVSTFQPPPKTFGTPVCDNDACQAV